MSFLIYTMILLGILLMVTNIYRYLGFLKSLRDVLSSGKNHDRDRFWKKLALYLLVFFLIGYIVLLLSKPGLMLAGILFGGSIFVSVMLTLLFHLIDCFGCRERDCFSKTSQI